MATAQGTANRWRGHNTFSGRLTITRSGPGGGGEYMTNIVLKPLAVTRLADGVQKYCGFRNGALNIQVIRESAQAFAATWDGNPDEGLKIIARNYGNGLDGATRIGAARALNLQARNSGTNISWVKTVEVNARNDSGKNVNELHGVHIRAENYGNIYTDVRGLDIEMSDENLTQSQERMGLIIRNTDMSHQAVVNEVFKVIHTAWNGSNGNEGFDKLFHFGADTGDTVVANTHAIDGHALAFIAKCKMNATDGYLPFFAAVPA